MDNYSLLTINLSVMFAITGMVDTRPSILSRVHYLHFAMLLSGVCVIAIVAISLMSKPRTPNQVKN